MFTKNFGSPSRKVHVFSVTTTMKKHIEKMTGRVFTSEKERVVRFGSMRRLSGCLVVF